TAAPKPVIAFFQAYSHSLILRLLRSRTRASPSPQGLCSASGALGKEPPTFPTITVGIGYFLCYIPRPRNSMKANTGYRHDASSQAVI
ncbi:MAG: hypothetical protein ABIO21_23385, partial [Pseudomonas sp.]